MHVTGGDLNLRVLRMLGNRIEDHHRYLFLQLTVVLDLLMLILILWLPLTKQVLTWSDNTIPINIPLQYLTYRKNVTDFGLKPYN